MTVVVTCSAANATSPSGGITGGFTGYYTRRESPVSGLFDLVDSVVGYQYLPDVTVRNQLVTNGASLLIAGGHSLGTITQPYLARHGLVEQAYLEAVPFGIVTPPNTTVKLGSRDFINFSYLNKLFNLHADVVPFDRWQHAMEHYQRFRPGYSED
ncbi:hypothetical protein [Aidingimonas lacisalsi]|uniref:hypothetical protein n=1 Tax=Aidingimonas lacisalsi TaxID=2604086 RepID=UPI0011D1D444|nr:hypothetical protein [Aidingimonas lacisalsi]